jgi:ribosomal protein S14
MLPIAPRKTRKRLVRPCLICGLRPGRHGIAVLACRLSRTQRVDGKVISSTLLVALCVLCLREAARDGRIPATRQPLCRSISRQ